MLNGKSEHALLSIVAQILFVINFETFPTTKDMDKMWPAIEQSFIEDAYGKFFCISPSGENNDEILPPWMEENLP